MTLPVSEIFETIQGEGSFTGAPAVFVRLQGCPVGCSFCDTKFSWHVDPANEVDAMAMMAKASDAPTFARYTPDVLAQQILLRTRARHVVITGGEPALYDLQRLSEALIEGGRSVQLETSGTHPVRIHPRAWVTVSPKENMPGGLRLRFDAIARADEIKWCVGKPADVEHLRDFIGRYIIEPDTVWLQPLSQNEKATALCIEAATAHGWRLSAQLHKYLGVR